MHQTCLSYSNVTSTHYTTEFVFCIWVFLYFSLLFIILPCLYLGECHHMFFIVLVIMLFIQLEFVLLWLFSGSVWGWNTSKQRCCLEPIEGWYVKHSKNIVKHVASTVTEEGSETLFVFYFLNGLLQNDCHVDDDETRGLMFTLCFHIKFKPVKMAE